VDIGKGRKYMSDLSQQLLDELIRGAGEKIGSNPFFMRALADKAVNDSELLQKIAEKIDAKLLADAFALAIMRISDRANQYPQASAIATYKNISKQAIDLAAEKLSEKMFNDLKNT
jgi:hypothetical protein